jgi:transposase
MKEMVTLNKKEQNRLIVLNRVERGMMTTREAAQILDLSLRHVKRIIAAYRKEGATALAHGNRGRKPRHTPDAWMKKKILELFQTVCKGCNHQHFSLLLVEKERIRSFSLFSLPHST